MRRREFLKTTLLGAIAAGAWQPVSAAGIGGGFYNAQKTNEEALPFSGPSLKGMITDFEDPACVNALNPGWMEIEFGPWCWDLSHVYNCKWALHLHNQIPNVEDVKLAVRHPDCESWWLL